MEVKHIIPAYSSAGHDHEMDDRPGKLENFILKIKRFGKKFGRRSSKERFSPQDTPRFDSTEKKSLKDRLPSLGDKLPDIDKRSVLKWGAITVISAVILVGGAQLINSSSVNGNNSNNSGSSDVEVKAAKATQDINKEFTFPLKDSQGEDVSNLKYAIEKAELRDEIIVQGKKATSIKGRTFLILTLKLTNEYTQAIEIDTKDYVRLSVNGNEEEWLAPDIHNDPVEVQAISTKYTRVGFPINDSDEDLVLRVGEIRGEKERLDLEL